MGRQGKIRTSIRLLEKLKARNVPDKEAEIQSRCRYITRQNSQRSSRSVVMTVSSPGEIVRRSPPPTEGTASSISPPPTQATTAIGGRLKAHPHDNASGQRRKRKYSGDTSGATSGGLESRLA